MNPPIAPLTVESYATGLADRPVTRMTMVRLERQARMQRITHGINEGRTIEDIAKIERVKPEAIRRALRVAGVRFRKSDRVHAVIPVHVRRSRLDMLDRLARRWRCDRAEAAARLIAAALDQHRVEGGR